MTFDLTPERHRELAIERIALDALGVMSSHDGDDTSWVREHLDDGCPICVAAAAEVDRVFELLLLAAPPVEPPAGLEGRVLQAISDGGSSVAREESVTQRDARSVWNTLTRTPSAGGRCAQEFVLAGQGDWVPTKIPGIERRILHIDEASDRVTSLLRMQPDTVYPRHMHAGDEQCFILEGDLEVDGRRLLAGDFQFAPRGSIHSAQHSEMGCTALVVASRHNKILTDHSS